MSKRIIYLDACEYISPEDLHLANLVYRKCTHGAYKILKNRYGYTGMATAKEICGFIEQDRQNPAKTIAIEDIATVFASEFVRQCRDELQDRGSVDSETLNFTSKIPFLKMNYSRRRKLVEKVLDKIWNPAIQTRRDD